MNNIKLLKAQCNLALSMIDKRARIGIDNYIAALEAQINPVAMQYNKARGCSSCETGLCPDDKGGYLPCTICGNTVNFTQTN